MISLAKSPVNCRVMAEDRDLKEHDRLLDASGLQRRPHHKPHVRVLIAAREPRAARDWTIITFNRRT